MHRQVEEYEGEIRFLKDAKSPRAHRSRTPRRSYAEHLREQSKSGDNLQSMAVDFHAGAFEAALFRPALQAARRDAAQWKAKATISTLLELPPLRVSGSTSTKSNDEEKTCEEEDTNPFLQLSSALSFYRKETASVKVIDLSKPSKGRSSRSSLTEIMNRKASASDQLDKATAVARQWLEVHGSSNVGNIGNDLHGNPLLGRVKFAGPDPIRTVSTATSREDLYRLQLHLVH